MFFINLIKIIKNLFLIIASLCFALEVFLYIYIFYIIKLRKKKK